MNAIVKVLADKYVNDPHILPAIAPLDEPAGFYDEMMDTIKQVWLDSWGLSSGKAFFFEGQLDVLRHTITHTYPPSPLSPIIGVLYSIYTHQVAHLRMLSHTSDTPHILMVHTNQYTPFCCAVFWMSVFLRSDRYGSVERVSSDGQATNQCSGFELGRYSSQPTVRTCFL